MWRISLANLLQEESHARVHLPDCMPQLMMTDELQRMRLGVHIRCYCYKLFNIIGAQSLLHLEGCLWYGSTLLAAVEEEDGQHFLISHSLTSPLSPRFAFSRYVYINHRSMVWHGSYARPATAHYGAYRFKSGQNKISRDLTNIDKWFKRHFKDQLILIRGKLFQFTRG